MNEEIFEVALRGNTIGKDENLLTEQSEIKRSYEDKIEFLENENSLLKRAIVEIRDIAIRGERLIEITYENPDLAEIILQSYFKESIDEYRDRMQIFDDIDGKSFLSKKIENDVKIGTKNKFFEMSKERFINRLEMSSEEEKNFLKALDFLKDKIPYEIDELDELFEQAYFLGNEDNNLGSMLGIQELTGRLMTTSNSKTSGISSIGDRQSKMEQEITELLRRNHVIK